MLTRDEADLDRLVQSSTVPIGGKPFVCAHIFLMEETEHQVLVYAWVKGITYYLDNGKLLPDGGYSMPYRFTVEETNGLYTVTKTEHPRDGSLYTQDIENLFPASVRRQIHTIYSDGTVDRMNIDLEENAKLYFHLS